MQTNVNMIIYRLIIIKNNYVWKQLLELCASFKLLKYSSNI